MITKLQYIDREAKEGDFKGMHGPLGEGEIGQIFVSGLGTHKDRIEKDQVRGAIWDMK
jgi:hypothetical protein